MAQQIDAVHASSCDHTKIITKLQSKRHAESPKVWLKTKITGHFKWAGKMKTKRPDLTIACGDTESGG